jgi:methylenetetrahydrofolate reductase (NADPH)
MTRASVIAGPQVASLFDRYSVELPPRGVLDGDWPDRLAPGSQVFVTCTPRDTPSDIGARAAELARLGFTPVPHIGARHLHSLAEFDGFLARLRGEAGVGRVLLIGGDLPVPRGPFASAGDVIATGLLERHGIASVGIAGYPEGHPRIAAPVLDAALSGKLAALAARGIEPFIVTQFCFEAAPILAWLSSARARGIGAPVRIGLAGPAGLATLVRYAARCGIGASVRAITIRPGRIARLAREHAPNTLVRDLAAHAPPLAVQGVAGLHFFTFGGIARTVRWAQAAMRAAGREC